MINQNLILVTDKNEKIESAQISNRNLEGNNANSTRIISNAIKKCVKDFDIYTDIELFVENIYKHKNDIIFPMKYGRNTPNSKSIIPGICEGANLKYIGADDYAHIICNDKYTSKLFAREFGIKTAACVLIRDFNNTENIKMRLKELSLPLVIKPNFGGGSTGISQNNVCFDYQEALKLCLALYYYHKMPILVEEYISGQEVEMILVGNSREIIFSEEVQLIMGNKESYDKEIWGFETKKIDDSSIDFKMSNFISQNDIHKIHNLFKAFDKIEFMRVDGRFHNGEFYLIELSPDCYLGDDCAFYYAFQNKGYSLSEMFEYLIKNGLNHYQY
ncbi:MAG: hypothetical protein IJA87_04340 [Clostridia bacterium]|nr:hypothetical protein [Clostridia bacterium]